MTSTPIERGWGNPHASTYARNLETFTGSGLKLTMHKLVVPHFKALNHELAKHYDLGKVKDDGAYNLRPIRGYEKQWAATHDPKYLSLHSWGIAEDLDWSKNPMTSDPRAYHEFTAKIVVPILKPWRGRMGWGGLYTGARKDYMHFEWLGTPRDAQVLQRQLKLAA